jgi:hypothetical protein
VLHPGPGRHYYNPKSLTGKLNRSGNVLNEPRYQKTNIM